MIGIDNVRGLSVGGMFKEYTNSTMNLHESKIYGESPSPDCPQGGKGGYCFKLSKCGLRSSWASLKGRTFHPVNPS